MDGCHNQIVALGEEKIALKYFTGNTLGSVTEVLHPFASVDFPQTNNTPYSSGFGIPWTFIYRKISPPINYL